MKYKLIATDYDHTLVDTPNPPTARTIAALNAFVKNGGYFTVSTGRMTEGVLPYLDVLPVNAPIISYQGGMVFDVKNNKILDHWAIGVDTAIELVTQLEEMRVPMNLYCDGKMYTAMEYPFTRSYCQVNKIKFHIAPVLSDYLRQTRIAPSKILSIVNPDEAIRLEKMFSARFAGRLTITRSSASFLEFNDVKASKGNAVIALAKHLNIPIEQVVCFGDSTNDSSMIIAAGLGVAMGNAMPEVKQIADLVADSVEKDGLAQVVEKIVAGEL